MDWEGTISLLFVIKTLYHRTIFCVYAIILIIMAQLYIILLLHLITINFCLYKDEYCYE